MDSLKNFYNEKADFKTIERKKKSMLSKKNIKLHLSFAKKYQNWTIADWERVIWSHETKVNRIFSDRISWY